MHDSGVGLNFNGVICNMLAFADGIVLLAGSEADLQSLLKILETWTLNWRMKVNTSKTKVIYFRTVHKKLTTCTFDLFNTKLEIVTNYKYLGVFFDEYLKFTRCSEVISNSAG